MDRFWIGLGKVLALLLVLVAVAVGIYLYSNREKPGIGDPTDYIYVEDGRIGLKEKYQSLPRGWRITVSHDGKTGVKILKLGEEYSMFQRPTWIFFDPGPAILPNEKPKQLVKIK
jgi:hypothetical protein